MEAGSKAVAVTLEMLVEDNRWCSHILWLICSPTLEHQQGVWLLRWSSLSFSKSWAKCLYISRVKDTNSSCRPQRLSRIETVMDTEFCLSCVLLWGLVCQYSFPFNASLSSRSWVFWKSNPKSNDKGGCTISLYYVILCIIYYVYMQIEFLTLKLLLCKSWSIVWERVGSWKLGWRHVDRFWWTHISHHACFSVEAAFLLLSEKVSLPFLKDLWLPPWR